MCDHICVCGVTHPSVACKQAAAGGADKKDGAVLAVVSESDFVVSAKDVEAVRAAINTCSIEPVPFSDAPDSEFGKVNARFKASLAGHNSDYVGAAPGGRDITFQLMQVERVNNPGMPSFCFCFLCVLAANLCSSIGLAARFEATRKRLDARGDASDGVRVAFHGTNPRNIETIARCGLLRVGHPLNPSRSTDGGWFGSPRCGVYVGRYAVSIRYALLFFFFPPPFLSYLCCILLVAVGILSEVCERLVTVGGGPIGSHSDVQCLAWQVSACEREECGNAPHCRV